jgi:hypothetical protein
MRIVYVCLTIIVFSALIAYTGTNAVLSEKQKSVATPRLASLEALSPSAPASLFSQPLSQPRSVAGDPSTLCLTLRNTLTIGPDPNVPDKGTTWRIEEHGDLVRIIPSQSPPQSPPIVPSRTQHGTLDQGSDYCPATIITELPYRDQGSMATMHNSYMPSCSNGGAYLDVFYEYKAVNSVAHVFTLSGNISGGSLSIRTGGSCPGSTEIACDGGYAYETRRILLNLTAEVTYYIVVDVTMIGEESYTLDVIAASQCNPDFDLAAPGTVSGNTCFAHNDCPAVMTEDQLVQVTLPHDGVWQFGLCDAESWYARIILSRDCCSDSMLAETDYGCPYDNSWYYSRPLIRPRFLAAGTYYLHIEGSYENVCGAWSLTVEERPPCTSRPANDDCENAAAPATLPVTFSGDNTCATHDCDSLTDGAGETWHAFVLDSPGDVLIDYCDSSTFSYGTYRILASGCPCQSLIRTSEYTWTDCEWGGMVFVFRNLPAGVYYYPVLRDSVYENEGPYTIHVRRVPSCQVISEPWDLIECRENPDSVALGVDCNKGCGSTSQAFQQVNLGQTVYGRGYSYLSQGHRRPERDWYEFTLEDTASVTLTVTAEFPVNIGIYERDCGYQGSFIWASTINPCSTLTITTGCLRPHTYAFMISPDWFMMPVDTMHYRATITSTPCAWECFLTEQPGDRIESEPICYDGYHDTLNVGCNGYPEIFQEISCGDVLFGTAGIYHVGSNIWRDMDWFHFETTENSIITLSALAEFDVYLIIADYCPGCDGGLAEVSGFSCDTVQARTRCVPPGNYYVSVFPTDFAYLPCGAKYRAWVTCEPCSPCPSLFQVGDILESEPPCTTYADHPDHFNGGCNSDPPVYAPEIQCGQTVWGTSGNWWGNGATRDTDWLPITLTHNSVTRVCVVAQFPVITAIVGPGGQSECDSVILYSEIASCGSCDTVCVTSDIGLLAGTYWLFIAPGAYTGVLCGSEYRAWITCDLCVSDTVRNVTIIRSGNDIVLNWTANQTFTGTYTVYHSTRDPDYGEGFWWEPLASDITPERGTPISFTHADAVLMHSSQVYTIVSACP